MKRSAALLVTLIVSALPGDPEIGNLPVDLGFTALWSYLLLRRSRTGWWVIVALYAFAVLVLVGLTVWPWNATLAAVIFLTVASLATLLASPTRAWVNARHQLTQASPST